MPAQKGVIFLAKNRFWSLIILVLILVAPGAWAREYIEVWPEGWSELTPLFATSIFADRFFALSDAHGISFLSVDGVYFKELDLTYRLVQNNEVVEEVVLRGAAEIDSAFLGIDEAGRRHVAWLERSIEGSAIYYTHFLPQGEPQSKLLYSSANTMQDLTGFVEGDSVHLAWSERERYFQIRYAQLAQGELELVESVTDSQDLSVRPSIAVDSGGRVHLAWMETSDLGLRIMYSQRSQGKWNELRTVGEGAVQDVQQGGLIALACFGQEAQLAWAGVPRNSSRLHVYRSLVNAQGVPAQPELVGPGSKPRFVTGSPGPELVWQGVGAFGAQVNYFSGEGEPLNLTVGRRGALRPEAFAQGEYRHVYWLHAQPEGGYLVYGINNQFPKALSFWRKVGIDEHAPFYHLAFLLISTVMLAAVYTVLNGGVLLAVGLVYSLLQRWEACRRQPLLYQLALIGALVLVVRHLPIPMIQPRFFGSLHTGLSWVLATGGSFLLLGKVRQRGIFFTSGALLIWMLLFQFCLLIPQNILQ